LSTDEDRALRRSKRRRWGFILAVTAVLLVIVVYETSKDLRERELEAAGGVVRVQSALELLRPVAGYYRSHLLPYGWTVGETEAPSATKIEVELYFSPPISSSRHGKAATLGEITPENACPLDDALRHQLADTEVWILVNDKTGVIAQFPCDMTIEQP
jgi:hypothetical protein